MDYERCFNFSMIECKKNNGLEIWCNTILAQVLLWSGVLLKTKRAVYNM